MNIVADVLLDDDVYQTCIIKVANLNHERFVATRTDNNEKIVVEARNGKWVSTDLCSDIYLDALDIILEKSYKNIEFEGVYKPAW